jgi:hypothetical protein
MQHCESDFVLQGAPAFKCCQIRNGGVANILESSICEVGLVRGHDDVGKCDQALQHIVLDDPLGKIFIEQVGFLFMHVKPEVAICSDFNPSITALASTSAPRLVLMIMTPFFIFATLFASIRWNVCGVSGQWVRGRHWRFAATRNVAS